jgi:hypothetical protein
MRAILPDVANDEFVDSHRRLSNLGLRPTERRNRSDVPHRRMAVVTPGIRRLMPGVDKGCHYHVLGILQVVCQSYYRRAPVCANTSGWRVGYSTVALQRANGAARTTGGLCSWRASWMTRTSFSLRRLGD